MKKLLILSVFVLILTGCTAAPKTPLEEAHEIASGENVSAEINKLQLQLERGEVTEKYAQEKLKKILKERQKQNSGDTESILKKIGEQDPMIEKGLSEMIETRDSVMELQ